MLYLKSYYCLITMRINEEVWSHVTLGKCFESKCDQLLIELHEEDGTFKMKK